MRKLFSVAVVICLAASAVPMLSADADSAPRDDRSWPPSHAPVTFLPRVNVVNVTGADNDSHYGFFAGIPMTVFHHNGTVYQSLITTDHTGREPTSHLLDDWKTYLDDWGGAQHINFIGNVSDAKKNTFITQYNLSWENTSNVTGGPVSIANQLAAHDWKTADSVVIAPYLAAPSQEDMESVANAAVLASLANVPLLLTPPSSLTADTIDIIQDLGASTATLVEIGDTIDTAVETQLSTSGISVAHDLTMETSVVSRIRNLTGHSTLSAVLHGPQTMPAALSGARYGGYVLFLPDTIRSRSNTLYDTYIKDGNHSYYKLEQPEPLARGYRSGEETLAQDFYTWLEGIGGNDTDALETVTTFNPSPEYDSAQGFAVTFDRAISGDPAHPSNAGAVTGRMPLGYSDNIAVANRDGMYRATIFANPRPKHTTLAMNAYEVQHTVDAGSPTMDKWGTNHIVNEVFGWPYRGWTSANGNFPWQDIQNNTPNLSPLMTPGQGDGADSDPGQFASFNASYTARFHSGAYPGSGSHPAQPGVPNHGFVNDVNNGSAFLYISCHGGGTSIAVRDIDNGVAQDPGDQVAFGDAYWPSTDGRVYDGSGGGSYSQSDLDNDLDNVHGAMTAYNACLMANGIMNEIVLEHGGAASVASYTSVSFTGSGWWWNMFVHLATHHGYTVGEAATYATARVAELYTPGAHTYPGNVDGSLQYVVYGDPNVPFVQANWTSPQPDAINVNYGGHKPDKPPHSFNVTISDTAIPISTQSTIDVHVADADTNASLLANVTLTGWGIDAAGQTAPDGTISFTVTPPYGENLTLLVEKEDYDTHQDTIQVTGGTLLSGTITASVPSLGVTGVLAPSLQGLVNASSNTSTYTLAAEGAGIDTQTNATGGQASLTVTPDSVGTLHAALLKPGYRVMQEDISVLTLHLGISHTPGSLTVGETDTLTVTINCTESGTLIDGATVTVQGAGLNQSDMTDSAGTAMFTVTPSINGEATISASRPGFDTATATIQVNRADISVDTIGSMQVDQQLPVTIYANHSTTGAPLDDADVTLTGAGVSATASMTNGVATMVIQPDSTGTVTVEVSTAGYTTGSAAIIVSTGPTGSVSGTVTEYGSGDPVTDVNITLYNSSVDPETNPPAFSTSTDTGGSYSITGIPVGEYTFRAHKYGYQPHVATITVTGGSQTHDITLQPASNYTVSGTITDANSGQLLWSNVTVHRADTMTQVASTETSDGHYSFSLLPYTYVFKVSARQHLPVQETVYVTGDMTWSFQLAPAVFADDVEAGQGGWVHGAGSGSDLWHVTSADSHSPTHAWLCGFDGGGYVDDMDDWLVSPVVNLSGYGLVSLSFWQWYEIEGGYDGGLVEISVDGGSWQQLSPISGYPDTISTGGNAAFPSGTPVFSGSSGGWEQVVFNLTGFVGDTVQLRFRFGSDGSVHDDTGWYIDDIFIFGTQENASTSVDIPLEAGWNLVTVPVGNDFSASSLGNAIPGCDIVAYWNASAGMFESYVVGVTPGDGFAIEDGVGYFVYVNTSDTFSVTGAPLSTVAVDLYTGWNTIGWFDAAATSASSLAPSVPYCSIAAYWNASSSTFESYTVGVTPPPGFTITRGMGVFVYVTAPGTWNGQG